MDSEMDLWLKIKKNTLPNRGQPGQPKWRKLVLVVTTFKKNCRDGSMSRHYQRGSLSEK